MSLTSKNAEVIGKRAMEVARKNNLAPMAVCVLNGAGQTLFFQMEDGNPLLREAIARGKATAALGLGTDSANMVKMYEARPFFFQALFATSQGSVIPVPGGVVIRDPSSNQIIGAVGMSGDVSEKDEWCCVEGIKSAGYSCAALKEKREPFLKAHL